MRDMLRTQEGMDLCLEQRDEELCQLQSQSQVNGAQLAALSLQMQELISLVESRAEVVGKDLEEINGWFDCYRGEINCLKIREKDGKEEVEQLKGFILGAGHEAQVFKNCLDRMELSYASVREDEYIAPPVENPIPLPVPALASCCLGPTTTLPALEEITEEPSFICEDLDGLLREADKGRARDLQEGSSQSVVRSLPRLGSERWRRLNGIHSMCPGPGGGSRGPPILVPISEGIPQDVLESFGVQEDLYLALELEQLTQLYSGQMKEFLPSLLGDLDWSSGERSLSGRLVQSLVSGFAIHLRIGLSEEEGDAFLGALGVNRMEEAPVVEMEGDMEVVDVEFECRD